MVTVDYASHEDMVPRSQLDDLRSINSQLVNQIATVREQLDELITRNGNLMQDVDTARACQREAEQELVNFKRRVTERMHREADRRQWCGEYDDIMEEMGLERRSRSWDVEFEIVGRVTRQILARDETRARNLAWEEFGISNNRTYTFDGEDVYVDTIDITSCEQSE